MPMLRAPLSGELLPTLFPKGGARAHDVEQCRQGCDGRLGPGGRERCLSQSGNSCVARVIS